MTDVLEAIWGLWIFRLIAANPILWIALAYGAFVVIVVAILISREEHGFGWIRREIRDLFAEARLSRY